ncbi:NAD(P)-binding protein [Trametopsis cervina]|nr:NAD(P)-binding protein [Trametopsis cervina]
MSPRTSVFLTGATGYIGGSVLARLLSHPSRNSFDISVLVRSAEKAKDLEAFGVHAIVGSTADSSLVQDLASQAHVVFSCADSDDLDAIEAVLRGLKQRHAAAADMPILIHTSGTGQLTFDGNTKGMSATKKIYYDDDPDEIESFPSTAPHRIVDTTIVQADEDGYVKTYIVFPSTIWGIARHPLAEAGISNAHSSQIPRLIKTSLARRQAGMVGKGLALWPDVEIAEQADLYITLYDGAVSGSDALGHGRNGYYFGENGEHPWYDISKEIGRLFVQRGFSKTAEPTAFSVEELIKYFGSEEFGNSYGSNSRARANHSRSIGWAPRLTSSDMLKSIEAELDAILVLGQ